MALDRNYFNSINLDPIKRKYYDVTAVDNLLVDIRKQAELINHRYEDMKQELDSALNAREDYRQKGQALSQEIIVLREKLAEAERRAEEAEDRAAALEVIADNVSGKHLAQPQTIIEDTQPAMEKITEMYSFMREMLTAGIENLDREWQSFSSASVSGEKTPSDLSQKIGKIAAALQEINNDLI